MVIGAAIPGGKIPLVWQDDFVSCLKAGVDIVSGSHDKISSMPKIATALKESSARVHEVRHTVPTHFVTPGSRGEIKAKVLLIAGTDCAEGKRTTAVELLLGFRKLGIRSEIACTGQTGIMLGLGHGYVIDNIIADYMQPAIETLICEIAAKTNCQLIIVEGQGALFHPEASIGAIGLLHGSDPDAIVLCHDAKRDFFIGYPQCPIYKKQTLEKDLKAIEILTPAYRMQPYTVSAISTLADSVEKLSKKSSLPVFNCFNPASVEKVCRTIALNLGLL